MKWESFHFITSLSLDAGEILLFRWNKSIIGLNVCDLSSHPLVPADIRACSVLQLRGGHLHSAQPEFRDHQETGLSRPHRGGSLQPTLCQGEHDHWIFMSLQQNLFFIIWRHVAVVSANRKVCAYDEASVDTCHVSRCPETTPECFLLYKLRHFMCLLAENTPSVLSLNL